MSWFYLALLAPLFFSITVLFDDNLLRLVYKTPYLATVFAGFFGMLPLLAIFFKMPVISLSLAGLSLLAGFLNVTYYFFYFRGLEVESPSVVVALFSLAPATIPVLAHFVVHEQLTGPQLIGFLVVLLGTLGLAVTGIKQFTLSRALVPVVVAVVFMDIVSIMTKYVYQKTDFYPAYMYFSAGSGLGGLAFFIMQYADNRAGLRDIKKILRKVLPIFMAAELINLAAEFTLNLAISRGPVSLVKVIEATQPIVVLLLAVVLYPFVPRFFHEAKEGRLTYKFGLMVVAVVGLTLIGLAAKT